MYYLKIQPKAFHIASNFRCEKKTTENYFRFESLLKITLGIWSSFKKRNGNTFILIGQR